MASTNDDQIERAGVYQLLARLWAEEPGNLLGQLRSEPLSSAWEHLGGFVPDDDSDGTHSSLDEDYCRLFIGPKELGKGGGRGGDQSTGDQLIAM